MENKDKNKSERVKGIIGTTVFHGVLVILLLILGLKSLPKEDEGILVMLGDSPTGLGSQVPEPRQPTVQRPSPPVAANPAPAQVPRPSNPAPARERLVTQDFEQAAAVNAAENQRQEIERKRLEEERRRQLETDRQKRLEEEQRRAAEAERQRVIAEEKRRQEELERQALAARNNVRGAFSNTAGTSTSDGETEGAGSQGALTGRPDATSRTGTGQGASGNSFSLSGRTLSSSLPVPVEDCNEEGVVVVEITVDKTGRVTTAQAILKGSRNMTACLRKAAEEAAARARFNSDANAAALQRGTITYSFGFKGS